VAVDNLAGQIFLDVFSQEFPSLPFFVGCTGIDDTGELLSFPNRMFVLLHAFLSQTKRERTLF
jgi:hypothetical protein